MASMRASATGSSSTAVSGRVCAAAAHNPRMHTRQQGLTVVVLALALCCAVAQASQSVLGDDVVGQQQIATAIIGSTGEPVAAKKSDMVASLQQELEQDSTDEAKLAAFVSTGKEQLSTLKTFEGQMDSEAQHEKAVEAGALLQTSQAAVVNSEGDSALLASDGSEVTELTSRLHEAEGVASSLANMDLHKEEANALDHLKNNKATMRELFGNEKEEKQLEQQEAVVQSQIKRDEAAVDGHAATGHAHGHKKHHRGHKKRHHHGHKKHAAAAASMLQQREKPAQEDLAAPTEDNAVNTLQKMLKEEEEMEVSMKKERDMAAKEDARVNSAPSAKKEQPLAFVQRRARKTRPHYSVYSRSSECRMGANRFPSPPSDGYPASMMVGPAMWKTLQGSAKWKTGSLWTLSFLAISTDSKARTYGLVLGDDEPSITFTVPANERSRITVTGKLSHHAASATPQLEYLGADAGPGSVLFTSIYLGPGNHKGKADSCIQRSIGATVQAAQEGVAMGKQFAATLDIKKAREAEHTRLFQLQAALRRKVADNKKMGAEIDGEVGARGKEFTIMSKDLSKVKIEATSTTKFAGNPDEFAKSEKDLATEAATTKKAAASITAQLTTSFGSFSKKMSVEELARKGGADGIRKALAAEEKTFLTKFAHCSDGTKAKLGKVFADTKSKIALVMSQTDLTLKEKQDQINSINKGAEANLKAVELTDKDLKAETALRTAQYAQFSRYLKGNMTSTTQAMLADVEDRDLALSELKATLNSDITKVSDSLSADSLAQSQAMGTLDAKLAQGSNALRGKFDAFSVESKANLETTLQTAEAKIKKVMIDENLSIEEKQVLIDAIHKETATNLAGIVEMETAMNARLKQDALQRKSELGDLNNVTATGTAQMEEEIKEEEQTRKYLATNFTRDFNRKTREYAQKTESEFTERFTNISTDLSAEKLARMTEDGAIEKHLAETKDKFMADMGHVSDSGKDALHTMLTDSNLRIKRVMEDTNLSLEQKQARITEIHGQTKKGFAQIAADEAEIDADKRKREQEEKAIDSHMTESFKELDTKEKASEIARKKELQVLNDVLKTDTESSDHRLYMEKMKTAQENGNLDAAMKRDAKDYLSRFAGVSAKTKAAVKSTVEQTQLQIKNVLADVTKTLEEKQAAIKKIKDASSLALKEMVSTKEAVDKELTTQHKFLKKREVEIAKAKAKVDLDVKVEEEARKDGLAKLSSAIDSDFGDMASKLTAAELKQKAEQGTLNEHLATMQGSFTSKFSDASETAQASSAKLLSEMNTKIGAVVADSSANMTAKQKMIDAIQAETKENLQAIVVTEDAVTKKLQEEQVASRHEMINMQMNADTQMAEVESRLSAEKAKRKKMVEEMAKTMDATLRGFMENVEGKYSTMFTKMSTDISAHSLTSLTDLDTIQSTLDAQKTKFLSAIGKASEKSQADVAKVLEDTNAAIAKVMSSDTTTLKEKQEAIVKAQTAAAAAMRKVELEEAAIKEETVAREADGVKLNGELAATDSSLDAQRKGLVRTENQMLAAVSADEKAKLEALDQQADQDDRSQSQTITSAEADAKATGDELEQDESGLATSAGEQVSEIEEENKKRAAAVMQMAGAQTLIDHTLIANVNGTESKAAQLLAKVMSLIAHQHLQTADAANQTQSQLDTGLGSLLTKLQAADEEGHGLSLTLEQALGMFTTGLGDESATTAQGLRAQGDSASALTTDALSKLHQGLASLPEHTQKALKDALAAIARASKDDTLTMEQKQQAIEAASEMALTQLEGGHQLELEVQVTGEGLDALRSRQARLEAALTAERMVRRQGMSDSEASLSAHTNDFVRRVEGNIRTDLASNLTDSVTVMAGSNALLASAEEAQGARLAAQGADVAALTVQEKELVKELIAAEGGQASAMGWSVTTMVLLVIFMMAGVAVHFAKRG